MLIGLSTHSPAQLDAALGAPRGPAERRTRVRHARRRRGGPRPGFPMWPTRPRTLAGRPWFAIGGIDPGTVGEVTAAGAERIVVVRAIRDAADPAAAAAELRAQLDSPEPHDG